MKETIQASDGTAPLTRSAGLLQIEATDTSTSMFAASAVPHGSRCQFIRDGINYLRQWLQGRSGPHGKPGNLFAPRFLYEPEMSISVISEGFVRQFSSGRSTELVPENKDEGIGIGLAILLHFLNSIGVGTAMVAWYPKLCGTALYPVAVVLVGITTSFGGMALMNAARRNGAGTFTELCDNLPAWIVRLVEVSVVLYNIIGQGVYYQIVFNSVNDQVFRPFGDGPWPRGPAVPGELSGSMVYLCLFACVSLVTTPSNFGGRVAVLLTCINMIATTSVLACGCYKGFVTIQARSDEDVSFNTVVPGGFCKVLAMVTMNMMNLGNLPQIVNEVRPRSRERAAIVVPWTVAFLQGSVFVALGFFGYFALGNQIEGDAFNTYAINGYEDVWLTLIQICMTTLLILSMPFCVNPVRNQLWSWMRPCSDTNVGTGIGHAPGFTKHAANLAINGMAVLLCILLKEKGIVTLFTITAGTFSSFVNVLLPALVLLWTQVIPDRISGRPWTRGACVIGWICLVAFASFVDAMFGIAALFK